MLATCYYKQLHSWYRHRKSRKYQPKDDPKKTTELIVLSDKRPITLSSDSGIVTPNSWPLPSSISSQPDNVKISQEEKTVTIVEETCEGHSLRKRGDTTNVHRSESVLYLRSAPSEEQGKVDPETVAEYTPISDSATVNVLNQPKIPKDH